MLPMRQWRAGVLVVVLLTLLGGILMFPPISQDPAYHNFADQRAMLGVPNLFDVASSLAFVLVGAMGIVLCGGKHRPAAAWSWMAFFVATVLTGLGSIFYHLAPDDDSLVWDRLPLAVAVMALFVAIVVEHADEGLERYLLFPALVVGGASVLWWWWRGDLRLFIWVQFAPLLCILLVLALFPPRYSHRRFLVYGLGMYALAKVAEMNDSTVFSLAAGVISGHTLKHVLAAGAIAEVVLMLRWRTAIGGLVPMELNQPDA